MKYYWATVIGSCIFKQIKINNVVINCKITKNAVKYAIVKKLIKYLNANSPRTTCAMCVLQILYLTMKQKFNNKFVTGIWIYEYN